jgi:hypothetical protein
MVCTLGRMTLKIRRDGEGLEGYRAQRRRERAGRSAGDSGAAGGGQRRA